MRNVDIKAIKSQDNSNYYIAMKVNQNNFIIKFDTGANVTVLSIDYLSEYILSDKAKMLLEQKLKERSYACHKLLSASGDEITGYLTCLNDVRLANNKLERFYVYLVINSKRKIALLGEDFLDNCRYRHEPHDMIQISAFDNISYGTNVAQTVSQQDFLTMIDEVIMIANKHNEVSPCNAFQ